MLLSWMCFFIGSSIICFRSTMRAGWAVLLVAYTLAFVTGMVSVIGIAWLLLIAGALYAASRLHGWQQVAAHLIFTVLALLLFKHKLPGFNNLLVFDKIKLSSDAAPYTMYLNLDKPFLGFILFTCFTCFGFTGYAHQPNVKILFKAAALPLLTITSLCLGIGFILHFIAWEPKLPPNSWIWVLNNLLLVAICEEAFFRGYLQGIMGRKFFKEKYSPIALFITAVLFGAAHTSGGPVLMLLAFVAGSGYGWAYYKGGIFAAILAHFLFNVLHFFLFTYPMAA